MEYDIYLYTACAGQPELDDLLAVIPELANPQVRVRLTATDPTTLPLGRGPGFLELSISEDRARELGYRLAQAGGQGRWLPVAYRVARVDKGQARQLASVALHRICQEKYPERHIETIRLHQEEVQFWTFAAVLKPLEQGQKMLGAPGPVVHIDKVDGHLWQPGEIGTWKGQIFTYGRHKPPSLP